MCQIEKTAFRDDISHSIAFKAQRVLFLANKFDIYGDFRTFALIKKCLPDYNLCIYE